MRSCFPSAARKCQSEVRLLHQPAHAFPVGPNYPSFYSPFLCPTVLFSFPLLNLAIDDLPSRRDSCDSLYLHTSNPEFFRVPAFPSRESSPDLRQPIAKTCIWLVFLMLGAQSPADPTNGREFFLFCRPTSLLLFLPLLLLEINLPSAFE